MSSGNGYLIVSFLMVPIQSAPTWAIQSVAQTGTDLALGLLFGESESILYSIGYQTGKYLVSRINALTGAVLWNQGFILGAPAFCIVTHVVLPTMNILLIAGPDIVRFIQIVVISGVVT